MPQFKGAHFTTREDLDSMYDSGMLSDDDYNTAIQKFFGKKVAKRSMVPESGAEERSEKERTPS